MNRFTRPLEPTDGKYKKEFEDAKKEVRKVARQSKLKLAAYKFQELWKNYKDYFSQAQFMKCGYCESFVVGSQDGDVEHFRPKGAVWELFDDPETWGKERPHLSNIQGRRFNKKIDHAGYWWLAYDWNNYLLSCAVCNRKWKVSVFPVVGERKKTPGGNHDETSLLLNPFEGPSPTEHLSFNDLGQISAYTNDNGDESNYGFETIRTCGLDRPSLTNNRLEKSMKAHELLREIKQATNEKEKKTAMKNLYSLGDERFAHCGMVRCIFEQSCDMTWEELRRCLEE